MPDDCTTAARGTDLVDAELVDRFLALSLPDEEWTHEAHLVVTRALLRSGAGVTGALDQLRALIPAHNDRVGLRPGQRGYHETLTRYYVAAVALAGPDLTAEEACARAAPERHWTAATLASDTARVHWVEPDRMPLPWPDGHPVLTALRRAPTLPGRIYS